MLLLDRGGTPSAISGGRVVDVATGPGPRATTQARPFSADVAFQSKAAPEIAAQSGGRRRPVGYGTVIPASSASASSVIPVPRRLSDSSEGRCFRWARSSALSD